MTQQESKAINVSRFLFVIGVLFIHFPIPKSSVDGINWNLYTPIYDAISSRFFLSDTCLESLFILSGYLFFKNLGGYSEEQYFNKIERRLRSLVLPYIFWNCFWLVYNLLKTYKLGDVVSDAELLHINSFRDFFACFWERGYGSLPTVPIAGYMWFIRDLFTFALLSPIYNYCYHKRTFSLVFLIVLLLCSIVPGWSLPGFNTYLYLGGLIAYRGYSLEELCNKINIKLVVVLFLIVNYIYYGGTSNSVLHLFLVVFSFVFIFYIALYLCNKKYLCTISCSSTYFYVTHILFLNIYRHILIKNFTINGDVDMCVFYFLISTLCVITCLCTYLLLKKMRLNLLLTILTGGRS